MKNKKRLEQEAKLDIPLPSFPWNQALDESSDRGVFMALSAVHEAITANSELLKVIGQELQSANRGANTLKWRFLK